MSMVVLAAVEMGLLCQEKAQKRQSKTRTCNNVVSYHSRSSNWEVLTLELMGKQGLLYGESYWSGISQIVIATYRGPLDS